ncbi:MAG: hypothetical protein A3I77_05880 [Gammaproteobacteria bacterium RIFCSPLOWO2_02_FULL_42_14]|nr:MAG: hypothetical protein A2624_00295 [Gammaproteobacteria bacterium RIFCSPHIGHO2_01_FULL_42_8]OGT53378.1 MAG: hypothetical protein A3E54_06625 [Gammaproteobacteria bacterium RIFCSPHIGHO2_12_FULL_41_25]OGT63426.1 MAG: hypothetical protein A3I77_05880 [Gammaproteobacteria bacterium RIFCSPLOWO2_02_FULL_42_14]OGT87352.1 MAG: hypothetical protein A3G86_00325 [Gammaproteobacteria bacterium RIFCSPLOWO2_12_FULL_42_18]
MMIAKKIVVLIGGSLLSAMVIAADLPLPMQPTSVPPTPVAQPAPVAPVENSTASTQNSSNAFGSTGIGRTAFIQMVRNIMPLNPTQIGTLRSMFDETQRAVTQFPGVPPKPTSSSILVNMSPGSVPPVIRLRAGYVTSLVFLDSTGQPWPVTGYDLGNPEAFNIQPSTPDGKSDMLLVQARDRYQQGNLAVMLQGENTPVMLTLMPGQHAVDYRVDLRMPGIGPNGLVTTSGLPQPESPVLLNFLDGVPPDGAKSVDIEGAPAQAWVYQGQLFLRTRVTVLSPGWIASMNSPDGTHVYELVKTPVILASERGEMIQLSVKGL